MHFIWLRFPGRSAGKESTCNIGDPGSVPGLGRSPGGGHDYPLQYSGLENPHGQRSLAGYSLRHHEELDMTMTNSHLAPHGRAGDQNDIGCKANLSTIFLLQKSFLNSVLREMEEKRYYRE